MTECTFREVYNITIKGGRMSNPIRSWKESGFLTEILFIVDKLGGEGST